jgi:U3 small nucleolar RNA-associated protein 13
LATDEDSLWLATGGSDSRVRLWELATYNCIHNLKGCQGVVRYAPKLIASVLFSLQQKSRSSVLKFRPGTNEVFAAGDDCSIRSWDVKNGTEKLVLESHYSQVTGLVFDDKQLIRFVVQLSVSSVASNIFF